MTLQEKYDKLIHYIKELGSVAVAFSGGVDSTLLAKVCQQVLGERAMAITVLAPMHPKREMDEADQLAEKIGIKHVHITLDEDAMEGFKHNPVDRCYLCKYKVFSEIGQEAKKQELDFIVDGSNVDDMGDYRPGMRAIEELKVKSPLKEAGLTKADIRELSKELDLSTWDKPAFACLATRLPYGEAITKEKLAMIEAGEDLLKDLGFKQYRLRHHADLARIEVAPEERSKFFDVEMMDTVSKRFKEIGYAYVTLDLEGYRMGKMNKGIDGNS